MRNAASVGGAILEAWKSAAGLTREGPTEVVAALLVLRAELLFMRAGQGEWSVALNDYLATGAGAAPGDLLVECRFPHPTGGAHAALARVARTPRDQSLVAAVALLDEGLIRIAVAAGGAPVLLAEHTASRPPLAEALLDEVARQAEAAVTAATDFRASAEYRRAMAGVLARRALAAAAQLAAQ